MWIAVLIVVNVLILCGLGVMACMSYETNRRAAELEKRLETAHRETRELRAKLATPDDSWMAEGKRVGQL